ncbi:MAG TPA: 50S ribosomal protein L22 [Fimbriiglobus sp.]|nr:50S ribosomal protein L22 [Fimbriiglobus sp.]
MFYKAKHKYADTGARKMRPFAQLVRGKNVDEAIEALRFLPNRGARLIEAVLKSAVGNAEDQGCRNLEDLVITECRIDDGPMFKRIRPRARGTAFQIKRRLAHIIVTLTDMEALAEALEGQEVEPAVPTTPPGSTHAHPAAHPTVPTALSPEPPAPTA